MWDLKLLINCSFSKPPKVRCTFGYKFPSYFIESTKAMHHPSRLFVLLEQLVDISFCSYETCPMIAPDRRWDLPSPYEPRHSGGKSGGR